MKGANQLKVQKTWLTRCCNALDQRIAKISNEIQSDQTLQSLAKMDSELNASMNRVSKTLRDFTEALDQQEGPSTSEQEAQIEEYIARTLTSLEAAEELKIQIEVEKTSITAATTSSHNDSGPREIPCAKVELPAVPIPTFTGRIKDFENFWALFSANVHQQNVSNLQKFNYLLLSLKGDAKEAIKRYPVTDENYEAAIRALKSKFGDRSKLIYDLQTRLERAKARGPSIEDQRQLLDYIISITTQLEFKKVDLNGSFIVQKILSKFNQDLQRGVLRTRLSSAHTEEDWSLKDILADLDSIITTEENVTTMLRHSEKFQSNNEPNKSYSINEEKRERKPMNQFTRSTCIYCDMANHTSAECRKVDTIKRRTEFLLRNRRCLNCTKPGHLLKECTSRGCNICEGKRHHSSLCPRRQGAKISGETPQRKNSMQQQTTSPATAHQRRVNEVNRQNLATTTEDEGIPTEDEENTSSLNVSNHQNCNQYGKVLLLTGTATVANQETGQTKQVRFLLDTGADRSFIDRKLAEELNLQTMDTVDLSVYTFGSSIPKKEKYEVTSLEVLDSEGNPHQVFLYKTDVITEKAKKVSLTPQDVEYLRTKNIAPPEATETLVNLRLLLGCDQLWPFLHTSDPQYILPSGLFAVPSKLGYLLSGSQERSGANKQYQNQQKTIQNSATSEEISISDEVNQWDTYWSLDSAGIEEFTGSKYAEKLQVNAKVRQFFNDTIEKREDGYYVRLPFKENKKTLPTNWALAFRRLTSVLNILRTKPKILQQYHETFQDQLEKGVLEEVQEHVTSDSELVHYLPHQPVLTPQKETTKLRIVYDASSHLKGYPSLNEVLHQGPLILPDLYGLLLRFRVKPCVAISDVEKAFLQVRLNECDRDVTRCLWIRDVNKPAEGKNIVTYRFTRVTFGLNVSPFLLAATILYHIEHEVNNAELACEISENLYVDNLILIGDKSEDILNKSLTARSIFQEMNMNLREFLTNSKIVQGQLPAEICSKKTEQKVLGILWNSDNDTLSIKCELANNLKPTKRIIAKEIASIYDPLGWLVPLLLPLKQFQQRLWKEGYAWDQELPPSLCEIWAKMREEAHGFQKTLQRVIPTKHPTNIAVFADASETAMAACAYTFNSEKTSLLMAKSKLPSIKAKTTIPKLEMNAITMGVRLARSVHEVLRKSVHPIENIFVFSDSQIVLNWVNKSPEMTDLGVLVRNRIREIRDILSVLRQKGTEVFFGYVPLTVNPADAGTRGLSKNQLENSVWWEGPPFLLQPSSTWKTPLFRISENGLDDDKEATFECLAINIEDAKDNQFPLHRYSSLDKATRVMGWILRFLRKTMTKLPIVSINRIAKRIPELNAIPEISTPLNGLEICNAKKAIIRNHQLTTLSTEYIKSMYRTLKLIQDADGFWKARGRLGKASLSDDAKFPIFISPKSDLAKKIIEEAHGPYHRGVAHIMATVRETYWIPKLRQQARNVTTQCIKCRRFNAPPYRYPETPDLPSRRVQESRPFENIGIDFFDLPPTRDGEELMKTYGCIFTCGVTRMIHIEVLRSMNTEAFLNALRRFFSRRGIPSSITCDNAPTFLLSAEILRDAKKESSVSQFLAKNAIEWKHITPYAPWQGGFYERLIKSIKHALYKSIGRAKLSYDSLETIITEVEATINTRPLTYQESDYEEFSSLRPIDFIQNRMNLTFPFEDIDDKVHDPDYLPANEKYWQNSGETDQQIYSCTNTYLQNKEKVYNKDPPNSQPAHASSGPAGSKQSTRTHTKKEDDEDWALFIILCVIAAILIIIMVPLLLYCLMLTGKRRKRNSGQSTRSAGGKSGKSGKSKKSQKSGRSAKSGKPRKRKGKAKRSPSSRKSKSKSTKSSGKSGKRGTTSSDRTTTSKSTSGTNTKDSRKKGKSGKSKKGNKRSKGGKWR